MLNNLLHRGAAGADAGTGDGAGILVQIPHRFFQDACRPLGFSLPQAGSYGAAMMFLPLEPEARTACRAVVDTALAGEGLRVLGWREVPTSRPPWARRPGRPGRRSGSASPIRRVWARTPSSASSTSPAGSAREP